MKAKLFLYLLKYEMYFKIKQCLRHKQEFFLCVNYLNTFPLALSFLMPGDFLIFLVYGLNLLFAN